MTVDPLLISILIPALFLGSILDLKRNRLPNALTVCTALLGLCGRGWLEGWPGMLDAAAGFALAAVMFVPLWIARWMGAGDVKMLMAIGIILGWRLGLLTNVLSLLVGIVGSVALLLVGGEFPRYLKRYTNMIVYALIAREKIYIPPNPGDIAARRFPYALAIATGALLAVYGQEHLHFVKGWMDWLSIDDTQRDAPS